MRQRVGDRGLNVPKAAEGCGTCEEEEEAGGYWVGILECSIEG